MTTVVAEQTHDGLDAIDAAALLEVLLARPVWHADAACRGQGPAAFFPTRRDRKEPTRAVRRACRECPVRIDCLQFALDHGSYADHGVWGGTSEKQRRQARRRGLDAAALLAELDRRRVGPQS
jgi:WhiB family redox-sensing transcriptional regulator